MENFNFILPVFLFVLAVSGVALTARYRWTRPPVTLTGRLEQLLCRPKTNDSKGKVAEAVTACVLARDGWLQVASKVNGNSGIDGLFVRQPGQQDTSLKGALKQPHSVYEVMLVETKANTSPHKPDQVSIAGVVKRLGWLRDGHEDVVLVKFLDELIGAVLRDHRTVVRELWRVKLQSGAITVACADADGLLGSEGSATYELPLVQALAIALKTECAVSVDEDVDDSTPIVPQPALAA